MLLYEYKLRLSRAQAAAIDEAIRTTQFIRNKAVRLWMDGRGVSANDLQLLCARLAQERRFCRPLNSQARQAAAARAWAAIERFYTNCREQRPGKKGYPRYQRDCRSVEYKQTGWQLGSSWQAPHPHRRLRDRARAAHWLAGAGDVPPSSRSSGSGWCAGRTGTMPKFVLQVERRVEPCRPRARQLGIDVGIAAYLTEASDGQAVANPRFIRLAEARLKRSSAACPAAASPTSRGRSRGTTTPRASGRATTGIRQRVQRPPRDHRSHRLLRPLLLLPPASASRRTGARRSSGWGERTCISSGSARTSPARQASALISSHDLIALEDLQVRNLVRNRRIWPKRSRT